MLSGAFIQRDIWREKDYTGKERYMHTYIQREREYGERERMRPIYR